jgi:hypothetical protein
MEKSEDIQTELAKGEYGDVKEEGFDHALVTDIPPHEQRKIIHKIDRRLVTILGLVCRPSLG